MKKFIKQIVNVYFRRLTLTDRQMKQLRYYTKVTMAESLGGTIKHKNYEEMMFDEEACCLVKGGNDYMWGVKCYANALSCFVSPFEFKKIMKDVAEEMVAN